MTVPIRDSLVSMIDDGVCSSFDGGNGDPVDVDVQAQKAVDSLTDLSDFTTGQLTEIADEFSDQFMSIEADVNWALDIAQVRHFYSRRFIIILFRENLCITFWSLKNQFTPVIGLCKNFLLRYWDCIAWIFPIHRSIFGMVWSSRLHIEHLFFLSNLDCTASLLLDISLDRYFYVYCWCSACLKLRWVVLHALVEVTVSSINHSYW